jgi:ribosomal protein L11 methyltransferase
VELAPGGFEEIDHPEGLELAAYGEAAERVAAAYPEAEQREVADGWEDRWREFHRPVQIGPLWIGPPWETVPAGVAAVVIDPGRAFGTGAHPTTRLCLELLIDLPRGSLLDVGTGSGVLAIAAAVFGFDPVTAIDVDEAATAAARGNATANRVSIVVTHGDALTDPLPASDVVVANVSHAVVLELAKRVRAPVLITSGYLTADDWALPGYRHIDRLELDGWAADLHTSA